MVLLLAALASCDNKPKPAPAIGVAHAGPATLILRQDIALNSKPAATVPHGERLDIVQRRRRFLKVRTSRGVEGWTDERLVISAEEMAGLARLAQQAKSMPAQGVATTYGPLNIHITPSRLSPSFLQVKEGEKMEVLMRQIAPRNAPATRRIALIEPPSPARKPKTKSKRKADDIPLPPVPAAPKLPADWIELSKSPVTNEPVTTPLAGKDEPAKQPEPPAQEEWSLIRISTGQSGWVLTRRLVMAIPDEVAQYAEGRRIVSYFPLGEIRDRGLKDAQPK
ncbi:MAG: hypothetical protein ACREBD_18765, partial [Blastocatellia bacterium]